MASADPVMAWRYAATPCFGDLPGFIPLCYGAASPAPAALGSAHPLPECRIPSR